MFRTIRNIFAGLVAAAVFAAIARAIVKHLSPETREKLHAHIRQAVESGKQAAAERRQHLEERLGELVGENNLN